MTDVTQNPFTERKLSMSTSYLFNGVLYVNGVTTNLFTYNGLDLVYETQNGTIIYKVIDNLSRPAGISLANLPYNIGYQYDAYGRFSSVTSSMHTANSMANYMRLSGSDLITGYTQGDLTRSVNYEPNRDLIASVENHFGTSLISSFDYQNNATGQRIQRIDNSSVANSFGFNSSGDIVATYDYSPFGKIITASGSEVSLNPLTFSSEISDTTLGLIYYNYRHYNPLDGCFFVRDPMEEKGGLRLYGFADNNGINRWDCRGLKTYKVPDCTYEVIAGHGFKDSAIKKHGGLLPEKVRRRSQVPADIQLGKNSAATVVACNDLWYVLIKDEDGWVTMDGGIEEYERAMTQTKLLHTSSRIQQAYDAAIKAAKKPE